LKKPDEILIEAASLHKSKDAEYGAGWRRFGFVIDALFEGKRVKLETPRDHSRFAILVMIAAKLSRYAANWNSGGHADSLRDIAVYAAMLESLDGED